MKKEDKNKTKYQITKKQCQKTINELEHVCDRCGRELKPIKTVDNADNPTYWAGCMHGEKWGHYTYGVRKEVYKLARKLVLSDILAFGMELGDTDFEFRFQDAVRKVCSTLVDIEFIKVGKPRYNKADLRKMYKKPTKKGLK